MQYGKLKARATFKKTHTKYIVICKSRLHGSRLIEARLTEARLTEAWLIEAWLIEAP